MHTTHNTPKQWPDLDCAASANPPRSAFRPRVQHTEMGRFVNENGVIDCHGCVSKALEDSVQGNSIGGLKADQVKDSRMCFRCSPRWTGEVRELWAQGKCTFGKRTQFLGGGAAQCMCQGGMLAWRFPELCFRKRWLPCGWPKWSCLGGVAEGPLPLCRNILLEFWERLKRTLVLNVGHHGRRSSRLSPHFINLFLLAPRWKYLHFQTLHIDCAL